MSVFSYAHSAKTCCQVKQALQPQNTRCSAGPSRTLRKRRTDTISAKLDRKLRVGFQPRICRAASAEDAPPSSEDTLRAQPKVLIDNLSDPLATIMIVEFGDSLGELLDTISALENLGLDISRAKLTETGSANCFYVTDHKTSEKIVSSSRLEEIRNTVLSNMIAFHPEAEEFLATGHKVSQISRTTRERGPLEPRRDPPIPTSIKIFPEASGVRSRLDVVTTDRSGLLVDIVTTLKDISVNVISAEIDTLGMMAHDILFLSYQGRALSPPMEELVRNALYYYLAFAEVETDESY